MPKLNKLKPSDIVDTIHVKEISEETGEVIEYTKPVYSPEAQTKLDENKNTLLSQKDLHLYLKEEYGNFFFYFYNKLDSYDIKPQYKVRFLYLASYLDYNSNLLVARGEYNVKIQLNRQMMKDILKLKDAEFKNTIKILATSGLLIKDGRHYKLNTDCGIKGDMCKTKEMYTRVFIKSIRELYDKCDPINHKQLYYLFKILPYINTNFNIPGKNTSIDIMGRIEPLTIKELCEKIGYDNTSSNKLWKILRGFKIGEDYVVCKHTIDENEYIAINPKVYYAGTRIENVKYLIGMFEMVK